MPRYNTALLVTNLSGEQRSDLIALLHDQLTDEPTIFLRMDEVGEPKKPELWLYWYLYLADLKNIGENSRKSWAVFPGILLLPGAELYQLIRTESCWTRWGLYTRRYTSAWGES